MNISKLQATIASILLVIMGVFGWAATKSSDITQENNQLAERVDEVDMQDPGVPEFTQLDLELYRLDVPVDWERVPQGNGIVLNSNSSAQHTVYLEEFKVDDPEEYILNGGIEKFGNLKEYYQTLGMEPSVLVEKGQHDLYTVYELSDIPSRGGMLAKIVGANGYAWLFMGLEPFNIGGTPITQQARYEDTFLRMLRSVEIIQPSVIVY